MSKTIIVIEDGRLQMYQEEAIDATQVVKQNLGSVPADLYLETLQRLVGGLIIFPQLQFGYVIAKSMLSDGVSERYVVEQKPCVLIITEAVDQTTPTRREIALPWVYFVVQVNSSSSMTGRIFFNRNRILTPDERFGRCPFPNQGADGGICVGNSMRSVQQSETITTRAQAIDGFVNGYWASCFNGDLNSYWNEAKGRNGFPRSFTEWAAMTAHKLQRNYFFNADWPQTNCTIKSVLVA